MTPADTLRLAVRIARERALEAPRHERPEYTELAHHLERAVDQPTPAALACATAYLQEAL